MSLVVVNVFVCMILGIVVVSDINAFRRLFGREQSIPSESEAAFSLSSRHSSHRYVTNSSVIMATVPQNSDSVSKSAAVQSNISNDILPNYDVHIFYYPWYGNPTHDGIYLHWNHQLLPHWKPEISARYLIGQRHRPPDDIGSSFYPKLGAYSSHDPVVVADHMRQIRQSGAGYFIITAVIF